MSYETVRRWVNHFGPMIAANLRKRRLKPHTTWQLDEVYLKIDGSMVYLWRAVDAEGEVLDGHRQLKRSWAEGRRFFSEVRSGRSACLGDLVPNPEGALARSAAAVGSDGFGIGNVEEDSIPDREPIEIVAPVQLI